MKEINACWLDSKIKQVLMKTEQPRLDDVVQRVVEAKYNKLQAMGEE